MVFKKESEGQKIKVNEVNTMKIKISKISILLIIALTMASLHEDVVTYAANIKINKKSITIQEGDTYKLKIIGTKKKTKWSSNKKKVATVSSKGLVTGKKAGKATITAKVEKKKFKCLVNVKRKNTNTKPSTQTSSPAETSAPDATNTPANDSSNVTAYSADALSEGIHVKVDNVLQDDAVLFSITNTNKESIDMVTFYYVTKDAKGNVLDTGEFYMNYLPYGKTIQRIQRVDENTDVSKMVLFKVVSNLDESSEPCLDVSSQIKIDTTLAENKKSFSYSISNTLPYIIHVELVFRFYDANHQLVYADGNTMWMEAGENENNIISFDGIDGPQIAFDSVEYSLYAYCTKETD